MLPAVKPVLNLTSPCVRNMSYKAWGYDGKGKSGEKIEENGKKGRRRGRGSQEDRRGEEKGEERGGEGRREEGGGGRGEEE